MAKKNDNRRALEAGLVRTIAIKDAAIQAAFKAVLSATIEDAVAKHNYDNQTGNLEDSYGWAIYHNHVMVESDVKGSGDGASRAQAFLSSYLSFHDWEGVVIAGAKYAADLEGYVRRSDGFLSQAGDELFVLGKFFDYHSAGFIETLKSVARL